MGLFGKRATAPPSRVLRAAGMRVDTTDRAIASTLNRHRDQWQAYAWGYRDAIGEVRLAVQFLSWAVSKVRFMAAQGAADSDNPTPIPGAEQGDLTIDARLAKAAQQEMERLPLDAGFDFWGMIAENFKIAGECWLHGYVRGGVEQWRIRSTDEVIPQSNGEFAVRDQPGDTGRKVTKDEELIRLWVPHPRWHNLPDSPMRSLLDPCEDLVLLGRELRAAARSRIAANGILKVPNNLSLRKNTSGDTSNSNAFIGELTEAITAPISNEGDPGGVAPLVITGEQEDLDGLDHLTISREDSPKLLEKAEAALGRVVRGLDIPPEYIMGMGEANHWTAWQIDATTYRQYIDPTVQLVCDSLTEGYLRPALKELGFEDHEVQQVVVWRDAGGLTENPNRATDAKDAWDRGAIGWDTFRDALGFGENDAPDDEELHRMLAFKVGLDPATAARVLDLANGQQTPRVITMPQPDTTDDKRVQQQPGDNQPGSSDTGTPDTEGAQPSDTPPTTGSVSSGFAQSLLAALNDPTVGWNVDVDTSRDLTDLDRELRARILAATDAAIERALEKAGSRVRSAAHNRDRASFTSIRDLPVEQMAAHLGRSHVQQLGLTDSDLLRGAFDTLMPKIAEWILDAALGAGSLAAKMLRHNRQQRDQLKQRIRDTVADRRDAALNQYRETLTQRVLDRMFDPDPSKEQQRGEYHGTITPPGDVRVVINSSVGGDTPSDGIHGGIIHDTLTDQGAAQLGFQWRTGPTPPARRYDPHWALNGKRFIGFTDAALATSPEHSWIGQYFRPGDHEGCLCDYMPLWAVPDADEQVRERLEEESPDMRDTRLLAELDDEAGRTGTTAQMERDRRAAVLELQRRYVRDFKGG